MNRLYGIVFLYHGTLFALSLTFVEWVIDPGFSTAQFMIRILIFATIEYLIFLGYRKPRLKHYGVKDFVLNDFHTNQHREISSPISRDELLKKLKEDPELVPMNIHPNQSSIDLVSNSLVGLPGNKISIKIKNSEALLKNYDIRISPKLQLFLFDNGKSKELMEHLERLLTPSVQQQPV